MRYFSRGKILVSGEYAVLYGAKALAIPSCLGQYLQVKELDSNPVIMIRSLLNDTQWFSCTFSLPGLEVIKTSEELVSDYVQGLFRAARDLKPAFFNDRKGYELESVLEFDTRWGLGSSSSLISNIALWMDIDPYSLLWKISGGSGYDIACARSSTPIMYQLINDQPYKEEVTFYPSFREQLFFVYLGKKQDSEYSVKDFRDKVVPDPLVTDAVSDLSEKISRAESLEVFEGLIMDHEELMSRYLGSVPVKNDRFPGFKGAMKSLGAWGGDLVLVTWRGPEEELREYFDSRGLKLVFRYDDLAIQQSLIS